MATSKRPSKLIVALVSVLVFASACGSSTSDPQTWAEAEADGNLRPNFIRACTEANTEDAEFELTEAETAAYCECAFVEIVEYFGGEINGDNALVDVAGATAGRDFAAFQDFENGLRDDPTSIPADVEALLRGCAQA